MTHHKMQLDENWLIPFSPQIINHNFLCGRIAVENISENNVRFLFNSEINCFLFIRQRCLIDHHTFKLMNDQR